MTNSEAIYILAIESSCDDTSAAVMVNDQVLSNVVANQNVHQKYGGVVPELASRAHQQNIVPVVHEALSRARVSKQQLKAVAYTRGPGLLGSLLVGCSFAKSFAQSLNLPLIEVNHMQAHVLANFIRENADDAVPEFPFLCLTVSGGHTQIVKVDGFLKMEIVGQTLDDAAGEAFDKCAKIMGLPYPGGPLIEKHAAGGDAGKFRFTHPKVPEFNYSFSGLKTAFLNLVKAESAIDLQFVSQQQQHLCASIQKTIIDILVKQFLAAVNHYGMKTIAVSGGVSANNVLRNRLKKEAEMHKLNLFIPLFEYCTDNAAMIAMAAYFKYRAGEFVNYDLPPMARYEY